MKRLIIILTAVLLASSGCQKEVTYNHTLGLGSERNVLNASAGSTPVIVWSNTTWTARFDTPVSWAGIDRVSGKGIGQVIFSYDANYGDEREVVIRFAAGGEEKTITMVQKKGN